MVCKKCQGPTSGYKCDLCDEEAMKHDPNHGCGGEHYLPKCQGCNQTEVKCTC